MPAANRGYVSRNYFLTLDGLKCGFLKSVEGGVISAEVIREAHGQEFILKKHLGQTRMEDFTVQIGLGLGKAIYDWIATSWSANFERKDGVITLTDQNFESRGQREFSEALITETSFPAFDAGSRDSGFITVKFSPENIHSGKASGKIGSDVGKVQKAWMTSNFRLEIDGLDCKRVSKVDSFTVKQAVAEEGVGDERRPLRVAGRIEFPDLKITVAESGAESWVQWHDEFVVKGQNDESREKNGALILLSPNLKTELARINFFNLGIFRLAPQKSESGSDQISRLSAELYCERMELSLAADAVALKSPAAPPLPKPARATALRVTRTR